MRTTVSFTVLDAERFKKQLLRWSQQFDHAVWLDSNGHKEGYSSFDALLAVDAQSSVLVNSKGGFPALSTFRHKVNDWIFGFLSYDLKNELEELNSDNFDGLRFPLLFFFQPKRMVRIEGKRVYFIYLSPFESEAASDFKAISIVETSEVQKDKENRSADPIKIKLRIFKEEYFKRVGKILAHIHRGNSYEMNFCQEFYAENTAIDVVRTYERLNAISLAPFSAFVKAYDKYVLCASPERYVKKTKGTICSQPIKGTAKRGANPMEDKHNRAALETDPKERSENIMIVDLVRNDLSKIALKGSVKVEELCAIYSFKQLHQMISTVSAEVDAAMDPVEIIKATFPMGSMTGAPKIAAMKAIEALESFKRGLYSGAVGYFSPFGDFDFNVVIRSILYNESNKYVSFSVGSAITANASPEKEYEECLLKAKAMREVLENK